MRFPTVKGSNLSGREFILPASFEGDLNVVALAFQMWHQNEVDTWMPLLKRLEQTVSGLHTYELPVIRSMNWINQRMIDQGMRGGIPDLATRARTITLYLDKEAFRREFNLPNEDHIYVLLVDRCGQVLWRTQGAYRSDTANALTTAIRQQLTIA